MNTQNAFTQGESLIATILRKFDCLNVKRHSAMTEILMLFLCFRGRMNFSQMGRQGKLTEKSYRTHFEKGFDWLSFNIRLIKTICSTELCLGFDPSYISKSGKKTPGLGYFYSGVAGKSKKGLEIGNIAAIDIKQNTAYHLESVSTPQIKITGKKSNDDKTKTLVDHYAQIIIDRIEKLLLISSILVVDGYFAKFKFVNKICGQTALEIICRLRDDANLNYLYKKNEDKNTRGRPKKYDGKVNVKKIDKRRAKLKEETSQYRIYEIEVYSVSLKRNIQLCYVEFLKANGQTGMVKLFFSTNCNRPAENIFLYYKSRFQMEFLFRDGKQYTGLQHCQARSENKLNFHFNASLTSQNIAKCILREGMSKTAQTTYSIGDLKIKFQNRNIVNRILSMYGISRKLPKNKALIEELFSYGTIAA